MIVLRTWSEMAWKDWNQLEIKFINKFSLPETSKMAVALQISDSILIWLKDLSRSTVAIYLLFCTLYYPNNTMNTLWNVFLLLSLADDPDVVELEERYVDFWMNGKQ